MRIRPQTQPTLVSSCLADGLLLRFPISDQSVLSCLFCCFVYLLDHLMTHHRSRPERSFSRPALSPSPVSLFLSHPHKKKTETGPLLTASSTRSRRPCEQAAALRCRPSSFRRGRKESAGDCAFFLGAGISSPNPSRSASASALVAWWNGMEWNGAHRATAAHHMPLSASAPAFSRLGEKGGSGGRRWLQASKVS